MTKTYILPNGKKAVFEYDNTGVGKVTLECMDELMTMIADRPQGEWIFRHELVDDIPFTGYRCSNCNYWQGMGAWNFCPNCGADMREREGE